MLAVSGFEPLFQESNSCVLTTALYRLTHDKKDSLLSRFKVESFHLVLFCFDSFATRAAIFLFPLSALILLFRTCACRCIAN
jgi:hypothetical protein